MITLADLKEGDVVQISRHHSARIVAIRRETLIVQTRYRRSDRPHHAKWGPRWRMRFSKVLGVVRA